MEKAEAVAIIEGLIHSLRTEPGQFNINLRVIGQAVSATNGGIGQVISAVGGGPGSTTIGNKVVFDGGSIDIGRERAGQAMSEQMSQLVGALEQIANEFRTGKPDRGFVQSTIDALGQTWVPPMITAVVKTVVDLFN